MVDVKETTLLHPHQQLLSAFPGYVVVLPYAPAEPYIKSRHVEFFKSKDPLLDDFVNALENINCLVLDAQKTALHEQSDNIVQQESASSKKQSAQHFPLSVWCRIAPIDFTAFPLEIKDSKSSFPAAVVFNRLLINRHNSYKTLSLESDACHKGIPASFILPPRSMILLASMEIWCRLLTYDPPLSHASACTPPNQINLAILDPPWPNRSADRSSSYSTMDIYDLFAINLPRILAHRNINRPCLVAVWVTNRPKYRHFVSHRLFPDWGIRLLTDEWFWLKVTTRGEPVVPLDHPHRRPYEGLVIGIWPAQSAESVNIPKRHIFASVPFGHSRKPDVTGLFATYLPEDFNVLELFARVSLPGWGKGWRISAGLEAIKFNEMGVHLRERIQ